MLHTLHAQLHMLHTPHAQLHMLHTPHAQHACEHNSTLLFTSCVCAGRRGRRPTSKVNEKEEEESTAGGAKTCQPLAIPADALQLRLLLMKPLSLLARPVLLGAMGCAVAWNRVF